MTLARRTAVLTAPFLAAALLAFAARPAPAEVYRVHTAHYDVQTDINPQAAEVIARHMEAIHAEYARRFASYGDAGEPFNVAVFQREADYMAEVPPDVRGSTGAFMSHTRLLAAHCENRTAEEVLRTLYHEGFHQFMHAVVSRECPIWLNEGIAEYFSEATWDGRGFETGLAPTARLYVMQDAVRRNTYIPFGEFFSLGPGDWLQNVRTDAHRASLHYNQAWSIVQFLVHADGGRYAGMLDGFLRDIAAGKNPADAFESAFGTDIAAFEAAWARYVVSLQPSPKFVCRDNMESALLLAQVIYEDLGKFDDVGDLRDKALRPGWRWQIKHPAGTWVNSTDRDAAEALFKCPYDGGGKVSYVLLRDTTTGLPFLVCDHHPGIILKAYYAQEGGRLRPVVEEQVREIASPELLQAVADARAKQLRR